MRVLFIGDIVGKVGRKYLNHYLAELKNSQRFDYVIANGENAAQPTIPQKLPHKLSITDGRTLFSAVALEFDVARGLATSIERIYKRT